MRISTKGTDEIPFVENRGVILDTDFYARATLVVARELLGKVLEHRTPDGVTSGRIVEVEAYIGEDDPACHAAPGPTARNAPLYGPPGFAYVYLNYGLHYLVNAVTEPAGSPAAVLIRALEPLEGVDLMRARRGATRWRQGKGAPADEALCRGPGNLTVALGITAAENALPLTRPPLVIRDDGQAVADVQWSSRIGIRVGTERLWRCAVVGNPAVSGPRAVSPADVAG